MNKECAVVQDLIPLVNDGIASKESKEFVLKHCEYCKECQILLDIPVYNEKTLNQKWQKKIHLLSFVFIIFISLIACSFTATSSQFNNFIIMPVIGFMAHWLLKNKVYLIYILIFVSLFFMSFIHQDFAFLDGIIFYGPIYCFFVSLGVIIHMCFRFVLGRK